MTRPNRRGIVKALRAPAPEPPPDLGRRIKDQIPDDLFAGRAAAPVRAPGPRGRAAWALAASVAVAIGAGYLGARLFEQRRDVSPELAALEVTSASEPSVRRRFELKEVAAAPPAPALLPPDASDASPQEARQELARAGDPAAAPEVSGRAERFDQHAATSAGAPGGDLGGAAAAPPSEADDDRSALLEVATSPATAVATAKSDRLPDGVVSDGARDAAAEARIGNLLEVAAAALDRAGGSALAVESARARTPGRVVMLVSAVVADSRSLQPGAPPPEPIEVELDSTAARGYRLLASQARPLAARRQPSPRASGTLYRVSALYEIELTGDPTAGAILGSLRLRAGVEPETGSSAAVPIALGGADLTGGWDGARAELRLAVLAAELASLAPGAPPALLAPIERDLGRLRADPGLDAALAARVAELQALAARAAALPEATALEPAQVPARNDG